MWSFVGVPSNMVYRKRKLCISLPCLASPPSRARGHESLGARRQAYLRAVRVKRHHAMRAVLKGGLDVHVCADLAVGVVVIAVTNVLIVVMVGG